MPAFIKTQKDEKIWSKAKSIAKNQYPDMPEDDETYWKITTAIYKKIRGNDKPTTPTMTKTAGDVAVGYGTPGQGRPAVKYKNLGTQPLPPKPQPIATSTDKVFHSPYGISRVVDTSNGPVKFSVLDPIQAHLSMYKNPALGLKIFEQKRLARLANISKLYPDLKNEAKTKQNLPAVPVFADSMDPVNVRRDAEGYIRNGSKPVLIAQSLKPLNRIFSPASGGSYARFRPYAGGGVAGVIKVSDISEHGSTDPQLSEVFRLEGSPRRTVNHELAHYLAYSPTTFYVNGVPKLIPVANPSDGIVYTSKRRGYGNAVAEAQGGMYRLAAWFANKFGYVPKTFDEAVLKLSMYGYLEPDKNSPHGAMKFSSKFDDPDINGFSTTLDDQLANYAYVHNGHIGPYKANIKPDGSLKTFKDRKYILDRQNEMWKL